MEFITIIENKPYYQWQIELLLESFKILGLKDNISFYIIGKNRKFFNKNIDNHKRCYYLSDNFKKFGFNYYDFYQAIISFKNNNPDKDFCIIDSDCILVKNNFDFSFNKDIIFQAEVLKKEYVDFGLESLLKSKVHHICSFMYFSKKLNVDFFKNSLYITEQFIMKILENYNSEIFENDPHIFKYGVLLNSIIEKIQIEAATDIVNFPQNNSLNNLLLSYKHDIQPFFKKSDYKFDESKLFSLHPQNPFVTLCNMPDYPNCIPLKIIAKSYLEN